MMEYPKESIIATRIAYPKNTLVEILDVHPEAYGLLWHTHAGSSPSHLLVRDVLTGEVFKEYWYRLCPKTPAARDFLWAPFQDPLER